MSNFNPRSHEGSDLTVRNFCILQTLFQSTLPRGERRVTARISWTCGEFQSTLPRGERPAIDPQLNSQYRFQSTLPRGERHRVRLIVNRVRLFQSTLPRGERQVLPVPRPPVKIYFNPRSHEGSDKGEFNALMNAYISIHAPTRGATLGINIR